MGIAAYYRGNAKISRDLATPLTWERSEKLLVEQINSLPAGDVRVFTDTVICRVDPIRKDLVLMHQPEKGWASYGVPFKRLSEIRRKYALKLIWFDRDEHSNFWLWAREGATP